MDYNNGKIYKLVSDNTDLIYIGSSASELKKRLYCHRCQYKKFLEGTRKYVTTSHKLFELGGKITIVLIEEFPCNSKILLEQRERYWVEILENVVNKCRPRVSDDEKKQQTLIWHKAHKDRMVQAMKKYTESHRDKIKERNRLNYLKKKEQKTLEQKTL